MKKFICFALLAALTLGLFGCGGGGSESGQKLDLTKLSVGFGIEDVTPDFRVGLGGFSDMETRKSNSVLDPIYVTCIAMSQNDTTVLLFTIDNLAAHSGTVKTAQERASEVTGLPMENIVVSATHTHSAPALNSSEADAERYKELFFAGIANAAKKAMEDRANATVYSGITIVNGLNFDRHYYMADGKYEDYTDNTTYAAHVGTSDKQMALVKFDRGTDKQPILLVNWQAHPDHAGSNGYYSISADYPGNLRDKVQADTGMLCAFFSGASGNEVPKSKIESEKHSYTIKISYGKALADAAIAALPTLKQDTGSGVQVIKKTVTVQVDHSMDHRLADANRIYQVWKSQGLAAGDALAHSLGINGSYHARAIRDRAAAAQTQTMDLYAFRVGGIGFVSGVYEMFSDAGMYIRDNAPFDTVLICNGNSGYIPSAWAYDVQTYEGTTGWYIKGTAEMLATEFVNLLNTVNK